VLLQLFITSFMIGLVSFGGGYAMIPLIEAEVVSRRGWLSIREFTDVIAVAGMSPGPIATNSAIFVGYKTAGIMGAIVAALGMILPSLMIILLVSAMIYKVNQSRPLKSAFYSLRAVVTGLIIYAAILFAVKNGLVGSLSWHSLSLLAIFALSLFALIRLKMHPFWVIVCSGAAGAVLFG
jgi:chromate transporter